MKTVLSLAAFIAFSALPAVADQLVEVPAQTPLTLLVRTYVLPVQVVTPGTELDFVTAAPTVVNGWVVIPKDAKAVGHLVSGGGYETSASAFSSRTQMNDIVYALDYVVSADGKKIKLEGSSQKPPLVTVVTAHQLFGRTSSAGSRPFMMNTQIPATVDHMVHVEAKEKKVTDGSDYDK